MTATKQRAVLYSTWRTGNSGCYGVVAVERVDGWKAYMGVASGDDEAADERDIASRGAPLMESEARGFFPQLAGRPYAY